MVDETFQEQYVDVNGIRIRLLASPDDGRPPLLLLHGITSTAEGWEAVMPGLAREYRVIAIDMRGHGRSEWPESGYSPRDYADDAAGLLDALGIDRAPVIGHSLGAVTTAVLAANYPEKVSVAVLEDPPAGLSEGAGGWLRTFLEAKHRPEEETYEMVKAVRPHGNEADWRRQTYQLHHMADGPIAEILEDASFRADFFPTVAQIQCPVLLLQADPERGAAINDEAAAQAVETMQSCVLEKFPDTGHSIHRERPQEFLDAVLPFLKKHGSS